MSEHTPGPWHISRWAGEHDDGGAVICDANGKRLASTESIWWKADKFAWAEYQANARLIAAAPELLVALERIVYDLGPYVKASDLQPARDAIAKARGKA